MRINEIREKIDNFCNENDCSISILEGPAFDEAIIGISHDYRLIYDFDLMVEAYMKEYECDEMEALDSISYDTMRAIPYFENAPIILTTTIDDLKEIF